MTQLVGAGYSVSTGVSDLSTFVKLLGVAMLVPIVLVIGVVIRRSNRGVGKGTCE
ncbi:hypothetical protein [Marinobacterium nitratireducens]|uniref:hypothetical protein n=1 Tax=Marinobacterium nitratireducens TaxID=518897 RepID=UPI001E2D0120|nr:hypothetical protein [Marinobacterium nitratireducens]